MGYIKKINKKSSGDIMEVKVHRATRFVLQNTMSERQQEQKSFLPLEKYGTYKDEERNDGRWSPQGRKNYESYFPGNFGRRGAYYEQGGYKPQPSHRQKSGGNMRRADQYSQERYTPYTMGHRKRAVKCHDKHRIHVTVWQDKKHLKRKMGKNTKDGTPGSWFKIVIHDGMKYNKIWLMNILQSHCSIPFTPVDFHYVKKQARFFVQDSSVASALKDVSNKICDENNQEIPIFVRPSTVPYSVQNKLEPEEIEQLKLTISRRYDAFQNALDLQRLRFDPDLVSHKIDIILNRRSCMAATLQVIKENCPELLSLNLCNNRLYQLDGLSDIVQMVPTIKSLDLSKNELKRVWELCKMKELKIEELWLKGNPLCYTFSNHATYISAIRDCFPKLLRLDGQELSSPRITDIERHCLEKPCKEDLKGSDPLKNLILPFLKLYYMIYDSGDRQGLLGAYHIEACFSLTVPFSSKAPALSSLCEYAKDSRNIKELKDPFLRVQLLKQTQPEVLRSLCMLPKTQHDLSSFMVDMWLHTETMLCFSVNGVFSEVVGWCQGSLRAFTRTFITIPARNSSGLCITNDELFVMEATPKETQSTFSTPVPIPSCTSMPILSQQQHEMVMTFSIQSGMNPKWSQKCLQENEWNYARAGQVFTTLKAEGKIPEEAFEPAPKKSL
ncbi:nuclear RNA export factor 2 [Manis pentadactyla]|uniref:nuclear RNA export factor 2 n=1 Tax=Manis pentadactyla TaxID=143292 RepID=UPI00255CBDAB|nr:nuclear RNA export factor 2 [Manis pentadactyla]